ncbi:MAG: phosphomethylpyrimidine kinase [candidate division WOR-3 bacterium]|nr:phosphomethylpyrimidine kinase [candidate division WOR-3 bacterium]
MTNDALSDRGRSDQLHLAEAVALIEGCREFSALVPEVRVNIVYAPEGTEDPNHVFGVDGRITVVAGMPKASGPIRPGVSDHMARLVVETHKFDPTIRAGVDFRWNEAIFEYVQGYCADKGLALGCIDRTVEPKELTGKDKGSIPWKVKHLVEACGKVPPVFYESRGWGKEPLFFLVGPDPAGVATRAIDIAEGLASWRK